MSKLFSCFACTKKNKQYDDIDNTKRPLDKIEKKKKKAKKVKNKKLAVGDDEVFIRNNDDEDINKYQTEDDKPAKSWDHHHHVTTPIPIPDPNLRKVGSSLDDDDTNYIDDVDNTKISNNTDDINGKGDYKNANIDNQNKINQTQKAVNNNDSSRNATSLTDVDDFMNRNEDSPGLLNQIDGALMLNNNTKVVTVPPMQNDVTVPPKYHQIPPPSTKLHIPQIPAMQIPSKEEQDLNDFPPIEKGQTPSNNVNSNNTSKHDDGEVGDDDNESCLTDSDLNISEATFLAEAGPKVSSTCLNQSRGIFHSLKPAHVLESELLKKAAANSIKGKKLNSTLPAVNSYYSRSFYEFNSSNNNNNNFTTVNDVGDENVFIDGSSNARLSLNIN